MKFDDDGKVRLDTRKYKVVLWIELDAITDHSVTPTEMVDQIRGGIMFKKTYDKLHLANLSMEYEVHVEDDSVELVEV
jgi:glutamine cyclotransferase|tara:strand:+ start:347 stop:580 length:234 start_codon:yes stop_codon:yes gene_type:complete